MSADPPSAGRFVLHFPPDDYRTTAPAAVTVETREDGALVWHDPYTGSIFGTAPGLPRLSAAHRWEAAP